MLLDYKNVKVAVILLTCFTATQAAAHKIHDPTEPKFVVTETEQGTQVSAPQVLVTKQVFPKDEIQLQGILNKKGRTVAIISGKLYAMGDQISGYKVNEINHDNVVLIGFGIQKRLYVYE